MSDLLAEIKKRLKQGKNPQTIKQDLLSAGQNPDDIDRATIVALESMQRLAYKKKWLLFLCASLILIAIACAVIFSLWRTPVEVGPFPKTYSNDPNDWVVTKSGGEKEVDVESITQGNGWMQGPYNQLYIFNEATIAFSYHGLYNGTFFEEAFFDKGGKKRMEVGKTLNPSDGILQATAVGKIENGTPVVYIFLDADWKNAIPETFIVWGDAYQNEKIFLFQQVSSGIFMDKIVDSKDRFPDGYGGMKIGGVIVGSQSQRDILNSTSKGKTSFIFR